VNEFIRELQFNRCCEKMVAEARDNSGIGKPAVGIRYQATGVKS
jgi:hypothetical protein